MSNKQPFCDGQNHRGTAFRPLTFNLDEKVRRMHLCGCKLSNQAPFCDGVTCSKIAEGEPIYTGPEEVDAATMDEAAYEAPEEQPEQRNTI